MSDVGTRYAVLDPATPGGERQPGPAATVSAAVLLLAGVVVRADGRTILDVESFRVALGEIVAVVGANGAGKTTLLHVSALLRRPDAGHVAILGQTATARNAAALRRAVSVVFQEPLLFDTTVAENAAAGLRFGGVPRAEAERRAGIWLERFGVAHLAPRRARELSGGEAGRVALARAFATDPSLLLLDEPFSSLDAPTRAALLPELRERLGAAGTAAVLVTHDLDEAFAFGDRVVVMERGRIVADGAPGDLVARPPSREVATLLGIANIMPAIVRWAREGCVQVDLQPGGPSVWIEDSSPRSFRPGQSVTVTLPAMAARVLDPDDEAPRGWNCLTGHAAGMVSLPGGSRLTVATPVPIVALDSWQSGERRRLEGQSVAVAFPPADAHIIAERR